MRIEGFIGIQSNRIQNYLEEFSWQHRIFLMVKVATGVWVFYLWKHTPSPGWAVAILAAVAATMSIHGEMRGWQKSIWMLLIGALLIIELRSIRDDHQAADAKALKDRLAQENSFKAVRDNQEAEFNQTAMALNAAIVGIKSTLLSTNRTLLQTKPYAALSFTTFEFNEPRPSLILPDVEYTFNFHYTNDGTASAKLKRIFTRLYIGNADDKLAQANLAGQFEKEWKDYKETQLRGVEIEPKNPTFGTVARKFSADEIGRLEPTGTIYFFVRFEYSDDIGNWITDSCESFQRQVGQMDINIIHPCYEFRRYRAPVITRPR